LVDKRNFSYPRVFGVMLLGYLFDVDQILWRQNKLTKVYAATWTASIDVEQPARSAEMKLLSLHVETFRTQLKTFLFRCFDIM